MRQGRQGLSHTCANLYIQTRARRSRFAGGGIRRWLTASGLELPAQIVNDVAIRFAPGLTPEEMLRPYGEASGGGRRGRRCRVGGGQPCVGLTS